MIQRVPDSSMKARSIAASIGLPSMGPVSVNCGDICMDEIIALEQKRLRPGPGQGIGETVSIIQGCRMAALAKAQPCVPGESALLQVHRDNFDAGTLDELLEIAAAFGAGTSFDDHGNFQPVCNRD